MRIKPGVNRVKTCQFLDKSQYECQIWGLGHMSSWKDMKLILLQYASDMTVILLQFTLFGERMGANLVVKRGKTS